MIDVENHHTDEDIPRENLQKTRGTYTKPSYRSRLPRKPSYKNFRVLLNTQGGKKTSYRNIKTTEKSLIMYSIGQQYNAE